MKKLNIYDFENEIHFLKNYLDLQENKGRGLLKKWSEKLNIHTTLMSQFMSEKRNLTEEIALEFVDLLNLNKSEKDYFICLVKIRNAGSFKLKKYYLNKKNELKSNSLKLAERLDHKNYLSDSEKNIYYSSWIYQAIRMYCSLHPDGVTLANLIEYFSIDEQKIMKVIDFLEKARLISKDGEKWKSGQVISHLEKESVFLPRYHANWRLFSMNNSIYLSDNELMYTSAVTISEKDFLEFREKIVQLLKDLSQTIKKTEPEKMAVLTIDFLNVKPK